MIVRTYFEQRPPRIKARGLTLEEAQAWCKDPETSSRTAIAPAAKLHTKKYGQWFDGFTEE